MFYARYPTESASGFIIVNEPDYFKIEAYKSALLASGFRQEGDSPNKFSPCPLGTFIDSSTKGGQGCENCPPGKSYLLPARCDTSLTKYVNNVNQETEGKAKGGNSTEINPIPKVILLYLFLECTHSPCGLRGPRAFAKLQLSKWLCSPVPLAYSPFKRCISHAPNHTAEVHVK